MNAKNSEKHAQPFESDALSDLVQMLILDVDIYHNAKVCGDWRIEAHSLGLTCFHIVTIGRCQLEVPGHFSGVLECGDLVIFPRELAHTMRPIERSKGEQQHLAYNDVRAMDGTGMLCGEVRFKHDGSRYLLDALPAVFILPKRKSHGWLTSLLELILTESHNNGAASKVILAKLSELLFTYALRQYLGDQPSQVGMLALYTHPRLALLIKRIHQNPEHNWTLASMAKEAALSRTVFAETFKSASGWSAFEYLTWWRMQLAWSLLSRGESLSLVAETVGYRSDAAFSRVFKKSFGKTVGQVRRGQ